MNDPITAIATAFDDLSLLAIKLSPAILELIQEHDGARAQRILTRRMKHCIRHCKRGKYGTSEIATLVALDFQDLPVEKQEMIAKLISFQLNKSGNVSV